MVVLVALCKSNSSTASSTHTRTFNGPFSGTTLVSWHQKGKNSLDFTEGRDSKWQWHQQGHMQVCISPQTDNHASTQHSVFTTWCYASAVLAMGLCLSDRRKSVFHRNGWTNRAGFWHVSFFPPALYTVLKEIRLSPKIRALPSRTLSKTPDLESFATAYRSPKHVINWDRERWTLRQSVINWAVVGQVSR